MVELTISGYLIGFSLGQLVWGPIGDRHGAGCRWRYALFRYLQLVRKRRLLGYAAAGGFFYVGIFAYIAGTPVRLHHLPSCAGPALQGAVRGRHRRHYGPEPPELATGAPLRRRPPAALGTGAAALPGVVRAIAA